MSLTKISEGHYTGIRSEIQLPVSTSSETSALVVRHSLQVKCSSTDLNATGNGDDKGKWECEYEWVWVWVYL